ncbi:biotin/lipoyl-binding protein [Rhizobium sp. PP-F2F-G38]|nr:biotin/lipoyl-binding protein [Rhizobium sp. PP-F2F-G38]
MFILVTVGVIAFLMLANFTRREQVAGFLVADPQIIRVNAPRPGRVQQLVVKEGQTVRRGDVLMLVDPDPVLVNGKSTAQAELDRLHNAEQEIGDRIKAIGTQVEMKVREVSARAQALRGQIVALNEGIRLQTQTIALLREQLTTGQALAKSGALSANELQKRDAALHDGEISGQNLLFSLHENEAKLAEVLGQKEQTPLDIARRSG